MQRRRRQVDNLLCPGSKVRSLLTKRQSHAREGIASHHMAGKINGQEELTGPTRGKKGVDTKSRPKGEAIMTSESA